MFHFLCAVLRDSKAEGVEEIKISTPRLRERGTPRIAHGAIDTAREKGDVTTLNECLFHARLYVGHSSRVQSTTKL